MGQTVQQIEAHIDSTREQLDSNLQVLERKVEAVTDWRAHYQSRPFSALGLAFAGGLTLAAMLRGRRAHWPSGRRAFATSESEPHAGSDAQKFQALEMWDNIKGALIALAATRFKDYIGEVIPGFDEHFAQTERRAASFPTPSPERMNISTSH